MASRIVVSRMQVWRNYMRKIYNITMIKEYNIWNQATMPTYGNVPLDNSTSRNVKRHFIHSEASFTRDGINNSRNVNTWSHENQHGTPVTKFQRRFSVNVWCSVLGNRLNGPFVFHNNLKGNTYEAFLWNELPVFWKIIRSWYGAKCTSTMMELTHNSLGT